MCKYYSGELHPSGMCINIILASHLLIFDIIYQTVFESQTQKLIKYAMIILAMHRQFLVAISDSHEYASYIDNIDT